MRKFDISQVPVVEEGKFVGSIDDAGLLNLLSGNPSLRDALIRDHMNKPFPVIQSTDPIESISKHLSASVGAALVDLGQGRYQIVTRHDIVSAMS